VVARRPSEKVQAETNQALRQMPMQTMAKAIPKVDLPKALARARGAREVASKVVAVGTRTLIVTTAGLMAAAMAKAEKAMGEMAAAMAKAEKATVVEVVTWRSRRPQTSSQLRTNA